MKFHFPSLYQYSLNHNMNSMNTSHFINWIFRVYPIIRCCIPCKFFHYLFLYQQFFYHKVFLFILFDFHCQAYPATIFDKPISDFYLFHYIYTHIRCIKQFKFKIFVKSFWFRILLVKYLLYNYKIPLL